MRKINRYDGEYLFDPVSKNVYELIPMNDKMKWCMSYGRIGGKEGAESIDYSDLGFFDPAGGPFVSPGYPIGERKVKKISIERQGEVERILCEVE